MNILLIIYLLGVVIMLGIWVGYFLIEDNEMDLPWYVMLIFCLLSWFTIGILSGQSMSDIDKRGK